MERGEGICDSEFISCPPTGIPMTFDWGKIGAFGIDTQPLSIYWTKRCFTVLQITSTRQVASSKFNFEVSPRSTMAK
jgi:hypothetical protein